MYKNILISILLAHSCIPAYACTAYQEPLPHGKHIPPKASVTKKKSDSEEPVMHAKVRVWNQPHYFVDGDAVFEGCNFWNDAGIECVSSDVNEANIRIYVDETSCDVENGLKKEDSNSRVLGRAWGDGTIILYAQCMFNGHTKFKDLLDMLRSLVAHEVGHTLGVKHVASTCDGDDVKLTPNAVPICGKAIMNPFINYGLNNLTSADHLAFQYGKGGVRDDIENFHEITEENVHE